MFRIDSVILNSETTIADMQTDFLFADDKAVSEILIQADPGERSLGSEITIRTEGTQQFIVDFSKDFYLNDQVWEILQDSSIVVQDGEFYVPQLNLVNADERLGINGNSDEIDIDFSSFKLQNFTELVKMDSLAVLGLLSGDVRIDLDEKGPITGDLQVANVLFNDIEIGDFDLQATKKGSGIETIASIDGDNIEVESDVSYSILSGEMRGVIDIQKLDLQAVDPFINSYTQDVSGIVDGQLRVGGTVDKPSVYGTLKVANAEAYVVDLQTKYMLKSGKLNFYENRVEPVFILTDEAEQTATLDGKITHNYYEDFDFDLKLRAEEFTFLDSEPSRKADFYGKLVGKVDATITGPYERLVLDADIKAKETTDATFQLLDDIKTISSEDYIIFYDGNKYDADQAVDSLSQKIYISNESMEINLAIETDPAALFHVIVDPLTGDKLDIRGTSNLLINIPRSGNVNMVGDFTVTEGQYRLSYENAIKRNFELDEGSKMIFQGSPSDATLDLRAIYETKTNTYALVGDSGAGFEDGSASNRELVHVILNVDGTLEKPDLSFDIQIPESSAGPVNNSVSQALSRIKQNETLLLEQVFSLILFNSFTGGSSSTNIASVGAATAVSSIGSLINSQLSKLAKNDSGFSLSVDLDQYKDNATGNGNSITEIGVGIQQKLLDDKLEISIGGNANLSTGEQATNNFSSFAGDFVVRYYLTDERNVLVKVFQKSDYDALENDSVWKTGIGLTYKKTFKNGRFRKQ